MFFPISGMPSLFLAISLDITFPQAQGNHKDGYYHPLDLCSTLLREYPQPASTLLGLQLIAEG